MPSANIIREKNNQSRRIYSATLRDEKNRRFVSCEAKETK